eukprot:CAMPEP_0202960462 /NCGR_PEP_ID=MMETSP1396-20130829/4603_1 /ASSEMBLY_ACC=CAM_ASM_000872 /TAXON_ID= /ORGANISM="Pseudokeronopsis sp., Strain Brazil" /LENGTH=61 /DNA_ID=CAMNT_0049679695 /DNA_START=946 /DNA_END=1131 /DNA_ORIENTATION=-
MTEEYKLHIFFHLEKYSGLKMVFVCEEQQEGLLEEFKDCAEYLFKEFDKKRITQTLEICET